MRELVLNSRHAGPRREKWGWELRPLRHFGEIRGLPRVAADEFREANFCRQVADMRAIRPELEVHFGSKSKTMVLSGPYILILLIIPYYTTTVLSRNSPRTEISDF